jgi:hypothetical protein
MLAEANVTSATTTALGSPKKPPPFAVIIALTIGYQEVKPKNGS